MMNYAIYQNVAMAIALVGAAGLTFALVFAAIWPYLAAAWDAMGQKSVRGVFLLGVTMATLYGGAKHIIGKITYPRTDPETWYLMDNGSYVTNDAVHVAFARNPILPASANIFIEGLELSYTNTSDWAKHSFLAYSNTLGNVSSPFDMPHPDATNYNWIAYTDWVPPPTTHTNGVAYASWQRSINGSTNVLSTVKTGIYVDALRISPNPAITNGPPVSFTLQLTPNTQIR